MKLTETLKNMKRRTVQDEINSLIRELETLDPAETGYKQCVDYLERLYKLREADSRSKKTISPDTILVIAGNLLGIAMILTFEQTGPIYTKALSHVIRGRV